MNKRGITLIAVLLALAVLCAVSAGIGAKGAKETAEFHWRKDVTGKYLSDDTVRQLVAVQCRNDSTAKVILFQKDTEDGKTVWNKTLTCEGFIGKNGYTADKKEGDGMTPTGDFGILTAFGIKKNPGTKLPYVDVTENTYCCGDEHYYNQLIDITECPHECADGEHLIEYTPEYNYGLFLDYNKECVFGKGSAIFFHCAGAANSTGGCVAVDEENMASILKALEDGARVIINELPDMEK